MNSMQGIIPVGPNAWKGARVIRVDALPEALPVGLQSDVLVRCLQERASAELCLTTAGALNGEVTVLLILRVISAYPYEAADRLDRLSAMVTQRLADANIRCHAVDAAGEDGRKPERFFSGDLAPISAAEGFFPPEAELNPPRLYVPGQYGGQQTRPVELGRLATLLSGYPNAMICLQLNHTRLFAQELSLVKENRVWFAARGNAPIVRSGVEAFSRLERLAAEPLFMVCFTCVGSVAFVRDITSQMQLYRLRGYRLPSLAANGSYVIRGNEWISGACIQYGHERHTPREMLTRLGRLTHLAPMNAVAAAFTLPQYTGDIKGIRINRVPACREPLPAALTGRDGIYLGRHFDSDLPVMIKPKDLTRHGFFVGKPGSGKTTFALGLLYRLYNHPNHYPFLAFEPAKTEYRSLMESIPDLRVYTPGREDVAPMQINPFMPPKGVRLEQYQQELEAIFAMAICMDHPLDIILPQVISRCYARYGWRANSTRDSAGARVFGIHEFIREFRRYIHEHYDSDAETLHNLENGGLVRLMALMQSPIFDTVESLDVEQLLEHPTIIELDALNHSSHKALVMGILLTHIMEVVRQRHSAKGQLRNLILIDEAHLLLSQNARDDGARPVQAVVELLQNMTVILRDYGTALMFGDQSPSRLTDVIMNNVELKMIFRLDSRQDRAILSDTAKLSPAMVDALPSMPAGEGFMISSALTAPIYIITPDVDKALKLDRALSDERVRDRMKVRLKPPFGQCAVCGCCGANCDPDVRAEGQFLARQLMERGEVVRCLKDPERQRELSAFLGAPLEAAVGEILRRFDMPLDERRLPGCARAQFIRALLIAPQFTLTEEELLDPGPEKGRKSEPGPKDAPKAPAMTVFQSQITPDNILKMCALTDDAQSGGADDDAPDAPVEP